ncbi:regulatory protein GemA [Methylobacterium sp. WL6]|uniref:regulatory protein GemA n=1 Tax=Methylobacterium sp. WL6 TaxID=2603901 RepID=UPI00164F23BA|nr:regulatory protein GemA [Methylobacterium sp. WL6]
MTPARIAPGQIRAIHAIKTRTRLDDGSYRAMLGSFGVVSSKDLSHDEAARLLSRLRDIPGADRPALPAATGRYAPKLQAMWIALWNLGAVRNSRDSAMHAFLERQTGIEHTRFLRDARDASAAVEALKAWLVREGVAWPEITKDRATDLLAMKLAIVRAQWQRGIALGVIEAMGRAEDCDGLQNYASSVLYGAPRRLGAIDDPRLTPADLDKVSAALGRKIRRTKSAAGEALNVD